MFYIRDRRDVSSFYNSFLSSKVLQYQNAAGWQQQDFFFQFLYNVNDLVEKIIRIEMNQVPNATFDLLIGSFELKRNLKLLSNNWISPFPPSLPQPQFCLAKGHMIDLRMFTYLRIFMLPFSNSVQLYNFPLLNLRNE